MLKLLFKFYLHDLRVWTARRKTAAGTGGATTGGWATLEAGRQ
jgi:hypothetical protein